VTRRFRTGRDCRSEPTGISEQKSGRTGRSKRGGQDDAIPYGDWTGNAGTGGTFTGKMLIQCAFTQQLTHPRDNLPDREDVRSRGCWAVHYLGQVPAKAWLRISTDKPACVNRFQRFLDHAQTFHYVYKGRVADQPRTEPRPPLRIRASDHIGSKQSC
jgi:hypothetical protein